MTHITRKQVREVFREFGMAGELYRGHKLVKMPDGWVVGYVGFWGMPWSNRRFKTRQDARAWVDLESHFTV